MKRDLKWAAQYMLSLSKDQSKHDTLKFREASEIISDAIIKIPQEDKERKMKELFKGIFD